MITSENMPSVPVIRDSFLCDQLASPSRIQRILGIVCNTRPKTWLVLATISSIWGIRPNMYWQSQAYGLANVGQDTNKPQIIVPDLSCKRLNSWVGDGIVPPFKEVSLDEVVKQKGEKDVHDCIRGKRQQKYWTKILIVSICCHSYIRSIWVNGWSTVVDT